MGPNRLLGVLLSPGFRRPGCNPSSLPLLPGNWRPARAAVSDGLPWFLATRWMLPLSFRWLPPPIFVWALAMGYHGFSSPSTVERGLLLLGEIESQAQVPSCGLFRLEISL